ncbi:MAG: NAD(P)H-binding protein, partial [Rhodospirillaceae bacterium]|nr:NAD(P)H-binding protein [Rhodospirillaceae bacterium]
QAQGLSVRVAVRHPERAPAAADERVVADLRDPAAVARALAGAAVAVNAVALYVERGGDRFAAVHVDGARHLGEAAARAGVRRLFHVSGVGADPRSESAYVRCRAAGEEAVRAAFPAATILRPCVMMGPDDAFLTTLLALVRRAPVLPLFGRGDTRLQPVHVEDVAEAAARLATRPAPPDPLYELGGPGILSYGVLLERVAARAGRRPLFVPVPLPLWRAAAAAAAVLPSPPITPAQVALMRRDNVAAPALSPFGALGLTPASVESVLATLP